MSDCRTDAYCDPTTGKYHFKPDQHVGSSLYYGFNWTDWLAEEGDTFDSVTFAITPATGLTNVTELTNGSITYIELLGVTAGVYEVRCTIECHEAGATQVQVKTGIITIID